MAIVRLANIAPNAAGITKEVAEAEGYAEAVRKGEAGCLAPGEKEVDRFDLVRGVEGGGGEGALEHALDSAFGLNPSTIAPAFGAALGLARGGGGTGGGGKRTGGEKEVDRFDLVRGVEGGGGEGGLKGGLEGGLEGALGLTWVGEDTGGGGERTGGEKEVDRFDLVRGVEGGGGEGGLEGGVQGSGGKGGVEGGVQGGGGEGAVESARNPAINVNIDAGLKGGVEGGGDEGGAEGGFDGGVEGGGGKGSVDDGAVGRENLNIEGEDTGGSTVRVDTGGGAEFTRTTSLSLLAAVGSPLEDTGGSTVRVDTREGVGFARTTSLLILAAVGLPLLAILARSLSTGQHHRPTDQNGPNGRNPPPDTNRPSDGNSPSGENRLKGRIGVWSQNSFSRGGWWLWREPLGHYAPATTSGAEKEEEERVYVPLDARL